MNFRIAGKNIAELASMELSDLYEWVCTTEAQLEDKQRQIAGEYLKKPYPVEVPFGCGLGILVFESSIYDLVRRGIAADTFGYSNRFTVGKCVVYSG